jgi:hypothetical protein
MEQELGLLYREVEHQERAVNGQFAELSPEFINTFGDCLTPLGEERYDKVFTDNVSRLQKFALENFVDSSRLKVDVAQPLDSVFEGSSSRVFRAEFDGKKCAIKIFKHIDDIRVLSIFLKESLSLRLAKNLADVGPGLYGITRTVDGKYALIMDELDGIFVYEERTDSGHRFVNDRSLESFEESMARLHASGYTFDGDGGQLLIRPNGEVQFCDIHLSSLDEGGNFPHYNFFTQSIELFEPKKAPWYIQKVKRLQSLSAMNK